MTGLLSPWGLAGTRVREIGVLRCPPSTANSSSPLTRLADVEAITADWVAWYNTSRLMHRLGLKPPAEHEADYYTACDGQPAAHT